MNIKLKKIGQYTTLQQLFLYFGLKLDLKVRPDWMTNGKHELQGGWQGKSLVKEIEVKVGNMRDM